MAHAPLARGPRSLATSNVPQLEHYFGCGPFSFVQIYDLSFHCVGSRCNRTTVLVYTFPLLPFFAAHFRYHFAGWFITPAFAKIALRQRSICPLSGASGSYCGIRIITYVNLIFDALAVCVD
jgi:hypothetical protein